MEPDWLDAEEQAAWRRLAALLTVLPAALDAQLQRDAGLTHFEYWVLSALSEAPDRTLRMSCLAGLAHGSLSRLSHVARRLERRGWLTRRPDPGDGRFTLATLTDAGWDRVAAAAPGHVGAVRRAVFDALTPEQVRALREIGDSVLRSAEAERTR
ncbi:MarR family winged helix-turn-helix transcriptional regulator [Kineococcus rhizosphaerae]|uniref:DNA-binding MarR family transcriptional regulator n=1 Tax=Kineococcus rhizosphaerae TaxID=559628 RepID=A0A2T0QZM0_9ACTN|nr:MarR family transcriptional regulator [Kineococcus rhizosphaerae]PRY12075.1 DNA-binding MarR family transcriptional regulator [Kineococcus rhizosphaerae]